MPKGSGATSRASRAYTRQFLEQLDKPDAERIDGIPPAIAVTHKNPSRSNRATVGTTTEVNDYLSLLFARIGEVVCYHCGQPVRRESPEAAAERLPNCRRARGSWLGLRRLCRAMSQSSDGLRSLSSLVMCERLRKNPPLAPP